RSVATALSVRYDPQPGIREPGTVGDHRPSRPPFGSHLSWRRGEPMAETILVEREGRVAILTINRPDKLNALNQQVRDEMLEILAGIEKDDGVGVVVITGAGEKSFIAGADIGEFAGRTPFDQRYSMRSPRVFDIMASFPKPVIAMINGYCLGGGCELAMSCDIRVASEKARFGQPEINLGLIPGGGGK